MLFTLLLGVNRIGYHAIRQQQWEQHTRRSENKCFRQRFEYAVLKTKILAHDSAPIAVRGAVMGIRMSMMCVHINATKWTGMSSMC